MTKITDSQKVQGLIIALINLAVEAGYNLDSAHIRLEDIVDPENTEPTIPFKQLVNQCLEYLASIDEQQPTKENTNHELIEPKKRYI